ncbi:hypothetical protein BGX34_006042 [Mortierella sp. NVP85]|nr:hypothetical protein BGX34_006042 [Mortierella sp. NVP85]
MDARSINPSGESNPTCDIDGNENMKQGTQAPDDTRIDILDQETSDTIGASVIAESLPYDVQSSSPMAFPSSNDADGTVLNFEVPDRQEEQNDASPTRIYFLPQDADSSATSTAFSGGTDYKPAVRVEASKFTKFVWKADIQEGLHDVRIVVNLKNLKIEEIETLSITQYDGDALEYLRGKASEDAVTFTMEFRTLHDPLPQGDPGYIELKYIELSPSHSSPVVNGVIMHQPFLWSVDVKIETTAQKSSGVIVSYSVSGDGNYVATLSTNGTIIQLDVWDLQLETQTKRGPFTPKPCGQLQLSISNDVLSDPAEYQAWRLERAKEELSISVSQDASMIALMCGKGKVDKALLKETFQLFSFENTTLPGGSEERKLQSLDNRIDAHLKTFRGFGKFHLINGRYSWMQRYITGRKTDMQHFIACDETYVDIYSIDKEWKRTQRIIHSITVEFQQEDVETEGSKAGHAAVVSISNDQSDPHMIFRTPPLKIRDQCVECNLHVDPISNHLITDYRGLVMVWKLPTTLKDSITLHTVLKTQPSNDMPKGLDESTKLKKCRHGQAYTSFYRELLPLYGNWTGNTNFSRFSDGLLPLISAFSKGDNAFQQAILQFVGLYIDNTLHGICDNVEESNYDAIHTFLEQLFSSSVVRWVPEPGETNQCNPIHRLLLADNLRIGQRASLARIMIDHCLHMSAEKQDWHFLSPVLDSLTAIAYHRGSFPDLIPKIFRKMAFLPVNDISFAVNAQSSGLQWPSREYGKHIINGSNKPILQSSGASLPKEHDQHNRHFAHKLHVAPFEMLSGLPSERNFLKNYRSLPSLILLFLLPVISAIYLDYYDFYLEALDHPAVTTLLEYKWNTIGFKYWTVKFAWKSIYYILVLLAVFMQVYDTTQRKEIFIAIIVMASIFLYFEVFQFAYNLLGYFKSPYNYINVLAFALPIMGSVKQLSNIDNNHDGDVSALSYSVLFIFLHIFFELRVFKDVSRFVAMVSRVLYEVRVFLLFFAMGILAFSIAILHLLRGCPADSCENNDVKFPQSFYRALSSTYFFMGGVWDPISNEFENGNWKFLIMMVLYFFFTNILLLNLIIGFRTASDVFPDEIYYYSTKEEMEKFYAKFSQDGDIPNGPDHRQDAAQGSSEPKLDPTTDPSGVIAAQSGTVDLKTVQQIQEALERQQEERHEDLKSELQISREQTITLQEQLRTQKAEFDLQLQTLQDQMSRILAALKVTS